MLTRIDGTPWYNGCTAARHNWKPTLKKRGLVWECALINGTKGYGLNPQEAFLSWSKMVATRKESKR